MTTASFPRLTAIIFSEVDSLRELARLSETSMALFYNGADLTNMDLSNEDLTGLNFDGADFTGTKLNNIYYEMGAFNNATIDKGFYFLQDEYDIHIDEVLFLARSRFSFHARIRGETIESLIRAAGVTYTDFAVRAGISDQTLWRARKEAVISRKTVASICEGIFDIYAELIDNEVKFGIFQARLGGDPIRQPFIEVLSLNSEGVFEKVDREFVRHLCDPYNSKWVPKFGEYQSSE